MLLTNFFCYGLYNDHKFDNNLLNIYDLPKWLPW